MTLGNAIKVKQELEKRDKNKFDYLIMSNEQKIYIVSPLYGVNGINVVVTGFFDINFCFHNINKKILKINDWSVVRVKNTILNSVTDAKNIIKLDNEFCDFYMININTFSK